jgi:hypothetical protein
VETHDDIASGSILGPLSRAPHSAPVALAPHSSRPVLEAASLTAARSGWSCCWGRRGGRAAGGGDAGVSEGGLNEMNGRTAVKSMGCVGMPEPVGQHGQFNAGFADSILAKLDGRARKWLLLPDMEFSEGCDLPRRRRSAPPARMKKRHTRPTFWSCCVPPR